ncbi:pentapeptide repeat-containing protein [Pricia sp. S334]|uniref:Pentapeptide repeat-containing protein n=1 Tax=Pricia mediterranea TaxID=3076079 RepID=A0ABU3LAM6_9FLAO|nr:pentapeptide repeat-containing protein [Pricia sp. S334]MDT7830443.1 pentapeptide repeat-containing protein [Pricia sp. S334]
MGIFDPLVRYGNVENIILKLSSPEAYNDPVVKYGHVRRIEPYNYVKQIFERHRHYTQFIERKWNAMELVPKEMIQLHDAEGRILYELEKSPLFPDYRAVLNDALATGVRLDGLQVISQNLDGLLWKGIMASNLSFTDCSLRKSRFGACDFENFSFSSCTCTGVKFRNTKVGGLSCFDSDLDRASFGNIRIPNGYFTGCSLEYARFTDSDLSRTGCHTTILCGALFEHCTLDSCSFVYGYPKKEWLTELTLDDCSLKGTTMAFTNDISMINFCDCKVRDI